MLSHVVAITLAFMITTPTPIVDVYLDHDTGQQEAPAEWWWDGEPLNAYNGTVQGPSGKETYYNLPMDGVVAIMRNAGYGEQEYPYWIRDDGVKMLGSYVIVAADQSIRPLGSIVDTSLGRGIVCDTGTFIYDNPQQIDIAVSW